MNNRVVVGVENLIKRYGEKIAVDNLSLKVYEGEIVGLLGPNGSGKTTTINSILGFLTINHGKIEVLGKTDELDGETKRQIGFVPQDLAIIPDLTVYENIDFFCGLYISDKKNRKKCIEEAIEFVGLQGHRNVRASKLSGGLKRRLNIACGIAHKPSLIFMDEPTVAVDAQSRNFMLEGIKKLRTQGNTIVYTTHYLDEAESLCDRIIIIDEGKNVADGSLSDLQKMVTKGLKVEMDFIHLSDKAFEELKALDVVENITRKENKITIMTTDESDALRRILDKSSELSHELSTVSSVKPSLTEIFLTLTGKELRE